MKWLEVSVPVDQEAVESASEILAHFGYAGGVVIEPAWTSGSEGPEFRYDPIRPVTLRTYLLLDEQVEAQRRRIEEALWHLGQMRPVGELQTCEVEEEDWANAWKQHYHVQHIGEHIKIVPSWLEYNAQPGDIVLQLDPGMAFGTGLHPTTQLCLQLVEYYVRPGLRTLDLGTGSGILAIAAAKLGALPVLALDNDPVAVEAARANAAHNHTPVQVALGSLGSGQHMGHWLSGDFRTEDHKKGSTRDADAGVVETEPFGLIVANLIAKVLTILAKDLTASLAPGGILIGSGIIIERESEVVNALEATELQLIERRCEGEWVALVYRKDDREDRSGVR